MVKTFGKSVKGKGKEKAGQTGSEVAKRAPTEGTNHQGGRGRRP